MIITDRVIIREVNAADAEIIYFNSTRQDRGDYQEYTLDSIDNLRKRLQNGECFNDSFQMLIAEDMDRAFNAIVYLSFVRPGLARLGIVIDPKLRTKGLGSHIAAEMAAYIFENFPVVRIEADTDAGNVAARKALEKAGFQLEGVLRKYRYHHGKYNDSMMFSMVRG